MGIKKETYHNHAFYTINNHKGLEITLCNYGASIYMIKYRGHYVTYHEEDYDAFLKSNKYSGKTIGRVAGRIKGGLVKIGSKSYHIEANEGPHALHGGKNNIAFKDFETSVSESEELINVVFKYTSPNKESGFPGEVRFIVVYSLSKKENKLSIHYHANASSLTPISMTTHTYWCLRDQDVLNHRLKINADYVTKLDRDLLILGKEKVNKIYDFRHEKKIGEHIKNAAKDNIRANGYDCGFYFNKSVGPQITLKNSKIKLSVKTDMDMSVVYTNCCPSKNKMNGYKKDMQYGGVAIEPQVSNPLNKNKLIDPNHPFDHNISFLLEDY